MQPNSDLKKMIVTITAVIGLLSSILTFFTTSFSNSNISLGIIILAATVVVVFIAMKWVPKAHLPEGLEDVAEEMDNSKPKSRFKVIFPCDDQHYKAANKLARDKFGKRSVSNKTVNDWKKTNSQILTCLSDNNRMVGYFDILPLTTDFAKKLINGEVGENDITGADILPFDKIQGAEYIYFAGIAVQNTHTGQGCIYGTYLLASAVQYVKVFYENSNLKKILTIPTSDCGLKLTKRLNFSLEREGILRSDGYDLYSKSFEPLEIEQLIASKQRIYDRFDISAYALAVSPK